MVSRQYAAAASAAVVVSLCCAVVPGSPVAAGAVTRAGGWGKAIEVPGSAVLNTGGAAQVVSVSCLSAGNCAAGGYYAAGSQASSEAFVVSEKNGAWGKAIEVPGSAALNTGGAAQVDSVSCPSAGNCAAGGFYYDRDRSEAFVVSEKNGAWGKGRQVPGLDALNTGGASGIDSVSCPSPGNCAASGHYAEGRPANSEAFVVSEKGGAWGDAIEVPGLGRLNTGGNADAASVSCGSAGNCAAGGSYAIGSAFSAGFVASEHNGRWEHARPVPGPALNTGNQAQVNSVSCGSAGNCAAGGSYTDRLGNTEAFVITETNRAWGQAIEVPGSAALNAGGNAAVSSISCTRPGACAAGGSYTDFSGNVQAFLASHT